MCNACMFASNDIYCKELAHMIMEAEKFQDLTGSGRRTLARAQAPGEWTVQPVQDCRPEYQRADGVSSSLSPSPKAGDQYPSSKSVRPRD